MRHFIKSIASLSIAGTILLLSSGAVSIRHVHCEALADATGAINSALAGSAADGSGIVWLHGACVISGTLVSTASFLHLQGDGMDNTWILPTGNGFDAVWFNPPGVTETQAVFPSRGQTMSATFDGFSIQYPFPITSVANNPNVYGMRLQAQGGKLITQPHITNIGIYYAPNGMLLSDAGGSVHENFISGFAYAGIIVQRPNSPDGGIGDFYHNQIVNYTQGCTGANGFGMLLLNAGGGKIHENGFACEYQGITANIAGSSSQLSITDNTYDTLSGSCIWLQRANTGVQFAQISVSGNKCAAPTTLYVATDTKWISSLTVSVNKSLGANGSSGSHFYIDAVDILSMPNNTMIANGGSPVGINIGPHVTNATIGPNVKGAGFAADVFNSPVKQVVTTPP